MGVREGERGRKKKGWQRLFENARPDMIRGGRGEINTIKNEGWANRKPFKVSDSIKGRVGVISRCEGGRDLARDLAAFNVQQMEEPRETKGQTFIRLSLRCLCIVRR